MKNTYSSCSNSIINDNIKTSQDFELSVIIFLAKHHQIPVASAHIDNTIVDNICNPVEHMLLYSPDTALKFHFFAMQKAENISLYSLG